MSVVANDQCLCVGQVISAVSSSGAKAGATVLAEDKTTGLVLRADVILDKIHSLKVRGGGAAPYSFIGRILTTFFRIWIRLKGPDSDPDPL